MISVAYRQNLTMIKAFFVCLHIFVISSNPPVSSLSSRRHPRKRLKRLYEHEISVCSISWKLPDAMRQHDRYMSCRFSKRQRY
jgi:hypothetical protein